MAATATGVLLVVLPSIGVTLTNMGSRGSPVEPQPVTRTGARNAQTRQIRQCVRCMMLRPQARYRVSFIESRRSRPARNCCEKWRERHSLICPVPQTTYL